MDNEDYYRRSIYSAIRIGFIALLIIFSFMIIKPFIIPVLWGIIIAVAIYPLHQKLSKALGGKDSLSTTILTIFSLALLIVPSILFIDSTINGVQNIAELIESGENIIPPPSADVANWKIIGKPIFDIWSLASNNMAGLITKYASQLKSIVPSILSMVGGLGTTIILFIISILISAAMFSQDISGKKAATSIFNTLMGKNGERFVVLAISTIRSVVQGVLGVAVIQALLAGVGLWAIGMPLAGVWTLLVLFFAIMQLPTILILAPLMVYSFSIAGPTAAWIFTAWSIMVGLVDNVLKPMFLGRGVDVPMLAILLGAIGGMLIWGIIGLFLGAVVLALSYKVFVAIFVDDALEN
ncbi:MAG: AI-2E family transporter [Flavobacteriales bacterium]|nr:AI-2E family transporter [Flavobacteriales bacterium]